MSTLIDKLHQHSTLSSHNNIIKSHCVDSKGRVYFAGDHYQGLSDPCEECTCTESGPTCALVQCAPPSHCVKPRLLPDKCCEFSCLNYDNNSRIISFIHTNDLDTFSNNGASIPSIAVNHGLGLRLIASTIASFLVLALLLFMIHRLRQRRLLLMIRRLQNQRIESNIIGHDSGCFSIYDQGQFGIRGTYLDPPPPYAFSKPPQVFVSSQDAPPPYEESLTNGIPIDYATVLNLIERSTTSTNTTTASPITNTAASIGTPPSITTTTIISNTANTATTTTTTTTVTSTTSTNTPNMSVVSTI